MYKLPRDEFNFRFGKIEGVKILPQRYPNTSLAAFIDFQHEKSATEAQDAKIEIRGCEIRTNYKSRVPRGELRTDREMTSRRHRSPGRPAEVEKNDRWE